MFHAQELGSYPQGQGSLAVFKVTARDQGHYKGPSGAFVTYCNISCLFYIAVETRYWKCTQAGTCANELPATDRIHSQRAHNVEMTFHGRRCHVITSHRRQFDVVTMSCASRVGKAKSWT